MLLQLLQNLFRFASLRDATKRARAVHSVSRPSLFTPHNDATRTPHHARHHTRRAHQPHAGIHRREPRAIRDSRPREIFPSPRLARASTHYHHHHPKPIARAHTHTHIPPHAHAHAIHAHHTPHARDQSRTHHAFIHSFVWSFARVIHSFVFVRLARLAHRIASHRIASHLCRIVPVKRIDDRIERADVTAQHRIRTHRPNRARDCRQSSGPSRPSHETHHDASSIDIDVDRSIDTIDTIRIRIRIRVRCVHAYHTGIIPSVMRVHT